MNEQNQNETALTVATPQAPAAPVAGATMWNTPALMTEAFRMADMLSKANILPQAYRNSPGDCIIAISMANRMGVEPLTVMQWSQVVQGNFTWKGTACKALIDGSGKYRNSRYAFTGTEGADSWGCRLIAERISTGETVEGPLVTIKLAKDEGWYGKPGSKWKTMPDLMLRYRAASFFAKTECPEVLMGFQTAEEAGDVLRANPDAPEPGVVFCEDCKQEITPTAKAGVDRIIAYSQKHWGANLCADCQRKRKAAAKPTESPVDAPPPEDTNTAPAQETPQDEWETAQQEMLQWTP